MARKIARDADHGWSRAELSSRSVATPRQGHLGSARGTGRTRSGQEALRQSQEIEAIASLTGGVAHDGLRPDLLVTDHLMPGMNGAQLIRELGSLVPDPPSLIVSGYAEAECLDPELLRLTKPFRKDELAAILAPLSARRS
ncbi:response regulator [Sphingomonas sp. CGMCC 1.13654]|uniref:Response regulator n=1 Tax=Sphingomonas chungangi TaxID=2683589 RepID=A0A838LCS2_9SPHN|nr:response regulator [Sphingomonas chungangi]MBA2936535.1 response regulator [Sphingomonas chungangi]MVW55920.1 response regulator [Sphingomonas chungangi]